MIAVIRIRGQVNIEKQVEETLYRLRLRKKYACVLLKKEDGMLEKVRNFVAYGEIDEKTLKELVEKRAKVKEQKNKKIDAEKVAKELVAGKSLEELKLKPFFSLHPPRGGIKSKVHFPKGVLGNNKEKINELIRRML